MENPILSRDKFLSSDGVLVAEASSLEFPPGQYPEKIVLETKTHYLAYKRFRVDSVGALYEAMDNSSAPNKEMLVLND